MSEIVQWICSQQCMVEGGPHDESCRPVKSELQDQVDRLARALAKAEPPTHKDAYGRLLHECPVYCLFRAWFFEEEIGHAPDCAYVWALDHVAGLGAGK